MQIEDSVAIVSGGGRGIGRAIVEALLSRQAKRVIIAELNESIGLRTVQELNASHGADRCQFVQCDVSNQDQYRKAFLKAMELDGRIDIVFNNAGILNENDPSLVIDVNVKGVIYGSQLALEFMSKQHGGRGGVVINSSSAAGLRSVSFLPAYAASKHAVVGWTGSMGSEFHLERHSVRFNCLCPASVETKMLLDLLSLDSRSSFLPDGDKLMFSQCPLVPMHVVTDQFIRLVEDPKAFNGFAVLIKPNQVEYLDKSMTPI